ncbi:transcriptional regulator PhoU [Nitrincola sp. A-D6]|uniref:phosphate signaling complex protein PhoU n=1 Tax=Nitrincola sp. A-D6 TaxID=1545442 RepID=UPI00051FA3D6|nr:phosphate signaling complex protein PhoU [Nitrincola sp. A-D6]KGK41641.1 transcriptional regulator PhoU [Nitrincola sp. A-D6]
MKDHTEGFSRHTFRQFNHELDSIRTDMLAMGGVVERQIDDAIKAFVENDIQLAEKSRQLDQQTNQMELSIDNQCTKLIAIRQPTASDLRLLVSISRSVSDLERVGDEASRICKMAIEIYNSGDKPEGYHEVRHIGTLVSGMIKDVLTAFARQDLAMAYRVAKHDIRVDTEYRTAMRSLVTYMMEDPRSISGILNVMWVLRSLERIGDHARNLSEHLIYQVSGTDVRHQTLKSIKQTLHDDSPDDEYDLNPNSE